MRLVRSRLFSAAAIAAFLATGTFTVSASATPLSTQNATTIEAPAHEVAETSRPAPAGHELPGLPATAPALSPSSTSTPSCIACVGGFRRETVRVSGPVRYNKKFVRYLTPAWAHSTGYSWSTSTSVSATLTANIGATAQSVSSSIGVSASRTQTYSVAVNIYANRSKLSKLGLYSDYNRYYVKSRTVLGGKPSAWKYSYLYSPLANQYLLASYK
jgi:hypothetical protein